jgi:hypothetical protein
VRKRPRIFCDEESVSPRFKTSGFLILAIGTFLAISSGLQFFLEVRMVGGHRLELWTSCL